MLYFFDIKKLLIYLINSEGESMSEFNSKDFGEKIKMYRIKKGLSQQNLANSL